MRPNIVAAACSSSNRSASRRKSDSGAPDAAPWPGGTENRDGHDENTAETYAQVLREEPPFRKGGTPVQTEQATESPFRNRKVKIK